jgi:hypothetical protein
MSLKDANFVTKAILFALLVAAILYSCEVLNSNSSRPDELETATPWVEESDLARAQHGSRAQAGSGTLVENGGRERVFREVACQALYDRQAFLRGYLAVFEEASGDGLGLRILVASEEQGERIQSKVKDGVYNASVRWYAEKNAFDSELTLKDRGGTGSLWTPLGTFHFRCASTDETDRYRNRRGPYERPNWLRSFERCDQLGPDPLPFWKRWLCKGRHKD